MHKVGENIGACVRCGEFYDTTMPALSRADNKTEICSTCGTAEALISYGMVQKGYTTEQIKAELLRELRHLPTF